MTNQAILEKAIRKAIDRGWRIPIRYQDHALVNDVPYLVHHIQNGWSSVPSLETIIFNHDFAKAIAKDEWNEFLIDLVLATDPIKNLENWL